MRLAWGVAAFVRPIRSARTNRARAITRRSIAAIDKSALLIT